MSSHLSDVLAGLPSILETLRTLGVAYVLALPIGLDREMASHSAGLRTFPLVAVATCGFVLLAIEGMGGSVEATARVMEGIITGIGFIGGGAILKTKGTVMGTATAAAIWVTAAIGAATSFQRYDIAVALSVVTYLTFRLAARIKSDLPAMESENE